MTFNIIVSTFYKKAITSTKNFFFHCSNLNPVKIYFFFVEIFLFLKIAFTDVHLALFLVSSDCGMWNASETITAIGTASNTQKNHIIVPHNNIHMNTTNGLIHKVFHIKTGTKNFSSDCCIIVYNIITAKTPHHPENISAETVAGTAQRNGPMYGIISNNHANTAKVPF